MDAQRNETHRQESDDLQGLLARALALKGDESFDGDLRASHPKQAPKAEAAVMVMVNLYHEPSIVLTKRQSSLRLHSGQVAFPGGRKDDDDHDLWSTARRETSEEIGMPADHPLENLGALDPHFTITRYRVTPYLALNTTPFPYQAEASEVAEIFEVPLAQLRLKNFHEASYEYDGKPRYFYVLDHETHYIWGATARILFNLARRLAYVGF